MFDWMLASSERMYQLLSERVAGVAQEQCKFIEAQADFNLALWNALLGRSGSGAPACEPQGEVPQPARECPPDSLEQVTAERVKKGLAPPREIYDVRNRGRIDWDSIPEWARPSDPEMFQGAHEG